MPAELPPADPHVLILWADQDTGNQGVRALAEGMRSVITRIAPRAIVEIQGYGSGPTPKPFRARHIISSSLSLDQSLQRWFSNFDLIVDMGGGDSFSSIYGSRRLLEILAVRRIAQRSGAPVLVGPQTIGPFETRFSRFIARRSVRRTLGVVARDSQSVGVAQRELGVRPTHATDVVFALDLPRAGAPKRDVLINVSGLLWRDNSLVDASRYRAAVIGLCEELNRCGREVCLLAHVVATGSNDDDTHAISALTQALSFEPEAVAPESLQETREVISTSTALVGSRMHACLNALSVGVPAVPWAYSRKFEPLLADLGWPYVFDLRSVEEASLVSHTITLLENFQDVRPPELAQVAEQSARGLQSLDDVVRPYL